MSSIRINSPLLALRGEGLEVIGNDSCCFLFVLKEKLQRRRRQCLPVSQPSREDSFIQVSDDQCAQ